MEMRTPRHRSLTTELETIRNASLAMNDMFMAEAALIARELLLQLMQKHQCELHEITAAEIVAELKQRDPVTYSILAIPETTSPVS